MQTLQGDYFAAYHNLKLTRDANGVLVVEFHGNGGPFIMTAQAHTEFVDAFYRIAQDRANKIGPTSPSAYRASPGTASCSDTPNGYSSDIGLCRIRLQRQWVFMNIADHR